MAWKRVTVFAIELLYDIVDIRPSKKTCSCITRNYIVYVNNLTEYRLRLVITIYLWV